MDFKELREKYNIDLSLLGEILKKNRIKLNMQELNDIPKSWIPVIEKHLYPDENISQNKETTKARAAKIKRRSIVQVKKYNPQNILFYAYVKFVGNDNQHAFVKRINDLNNISEIDFRKKDSNDYKIQEDCSNITSGQIITCKSLSEKLNTAKIKSTHLEGLLIRNGTTNTFVDCVSFKELSKINIVGVLNGFELGSSVVSVQIKKVRKQLYCTKESIVPNKEKIEYVVEKQIERLLLKEELSNFDKGNLKAFKEIYASKFESLTTTLFSKEVEAGININDLNLLLSKWIVINPEIITLRNLKNIERIPQYFNLWFNNDLPLKFWEDNLIDAIIQNLSDLDKDSCETFFSKFTQVYIELLSAAIVDYFRYDFIIELPKHFQIIKRLIDISTIGNKQQFRAELKIRLSPNLSFELWVLDKTGAFDKEAAIRSFSERDISTQEQILVALDEDELLNLLPLKTELLNPALEERLYKLILKKVALDIKCICFDLESNGEEIFEIGWINSHNNWKHYKERAEIKEGIEVFSNLTYNSNTIFVGHNIVEWDIPILSKFNAPVSSEQVWDTLLVEAFLSPEFKNYALITKHNAKDDSIVTLDLFLNQLLRIIYSNEEKLSYLYKYLPENIVIILQQLKKDFVFEWNPLEYLLRDKKYFFRPQPKPNKLVSKLTQELSNSNGLSKLVIGSSTFKNEILPIENIQFHSDDQSGKYFYQLDLHKINEIDDSKLFVKQILLNFVAYNSSLNKPLYWGLLPANIKIQVENNFDDIFKLFLPLEEIKWQNKNLLFLTIPELLAYRTHLAQLDTLDVFTIQSDLISIEHKQLLKEVSLDYLITNSNNDDHLWLKFTGGQSLANLSKEQCKILDADIPELYDNFWIKKVTLDKFNIWGNYNWEKLVDSFNVQNKISVTLNFDEVKPDKAFFAKVSAVEALKSKVIRYNPESLYRSRYWVFQKQLVDQIVDDSKPSILLIQNYQEIEVLRNYFTHLGYYIPDNSISIARRLELLHQRTSKHKLIIEQTSKLDKIANANYKGGLNIIIDSFDLSENYYAAINSKYFKQLNIARANTSIQIDEEDLNTKTAIKDLSKKPIISDTYFLLQLLKPRISHIRSVLNHADPDHQLWLLDPRLNDFSELHKSWKTSIRHLKVWRDNEAYEIAVQKADIHIPSSKPLNEIPYDLETIRGILKQVFLEDKHDWRDNQVPYLNLILKGEENQLVTLPTGGGKSLLFQAPALFKSTFTNKLTIVVTPLKALMEDQVDALWQKGFFGSVEYLNSDRSTDIQSIYRAMAGGELALIFVTPERFRSRSFNDALQLRIQSDGGLQYAVFDEAHCVSQWGHEFRPDYFNCAKRIQQLKILSSDEFPLLLFSATVSEKIYNDFNLIFS